MSNTTATVLIVDDEVHVRKLLEVLLQNQGYQTVTASSGEEALAVVERQPPDLILLDIMMPGMDGYEVATRLKADKTTFNIPIIMLSALGEHSARLAGLDAGAEDFLSKPVDSAELWLKVRNLLRLKAFGDYLKSHSLMLEEQLQQRTIDLERFRSAMDVTGDAIFLVSRSTMRLVEFNRRASQLLGYSAEELLHMTPADLSDATLDQLALLYDQIIAGSVSSEPEETRLHCKNGSYIPVEIHRQAYKSGDDWIIVGVARDISKRVESDQRMLKMAHYDILTGLPNRTLFATNLQMGITQASLSNWQLAVVNLCMNDFKSVSETLGYLQGDQMLTEFSRRLSNCLGVSDTLGRMNDDEFAMILIIRRGQANTQQMVDRIREVLQTPFEIEGRDIAMTASIGIAIYPGDGQDADNLIKNAHTAMHLARKAGRDTYRFYTAQMNIEVSARLALEIDLREAVKHERFELFYQPKISVKDGRVCGLEALLRWPRPGLPHISPAVFVPLLEDLGLITELGKWVIIRVCKQIAGWQRLGLGQFQVAVNVSGHQIIEGDLIADIQQALGDQQVDPQLLEVELTESSLMENTAHTIARLQALQDMGVNVSIDDFGTGYSSLAYLRRFPINKLKIDIAFIREVTSNPQDAAIAKTIIELAHSLSLEVIAEGVETPDQLAFLIANGCDQMQGYLFSKPLPVDELETLLRDQKRFF